MASRAELSTQWDSDELSLHEGAGMPLPLLVSYSLYGYTYGVSVRKPKNQGKEKIVL